MEGQADVATAADCKSVPSGNLVRIHEHPPPDTSCLKVRISGLLFTINILGSIYLGIQWNIIARFVIINLIS